jgi:hypothetical protein
MSEDPSSVGDPGGAPAVRAPDPPRRRAIAWRVLVPLGVAAAITLGVVGWAAAAGNGNAAPAPSVAEAVAGTHNAWPYGGWWGGPGFGPGWFAGSGQALHGECVVATDDGGTQTRLFQRGEVTEVTKSSITLKSSDGFTKRYVVNGDTIVHGDEGGIGSVAKNEEVVVTALHDGGDPTAQRIVDLTDLKN